MSKAIAFLGVAAIALGAAALPGAAAAADYYDGGDRPLAFHSRDDVYIDGGRARLQHRQEFAPAFREPRGPGPVVYDEREPDRLDGGPAYGGPRLRPPAPIGYGYGRPAAFAPGGERFYGGQRFNEGQRFFEGEGGDGYRAAPLYRAAADPGFDGHYGRPDGGCTVERAQSITPYGWRKIVTHRTCYRR